MGVRSFWVSWREWALGFADVLLKHNCRGKPVQDPPRRNDIKHGAWRVLWSIGLRRNATL